MFDRDPYDAGGRNPYAGDDVRDPRGAPDELDEPGDTDAPDAPEEPDEDSDPEEDTEPASALRKAARAVSEKATARHRAVKPETDS